MRYHQRYLPLLSPCRLSPPTTPYPLGASPNHLEPSSLFCFIIELATGRRSSEVFKGSIAIPHNSLLLQMTLNFQYKQAIIVLCLALE